MDFFFVVFKDMVNVYDKNKLCVIYLMVLLLLEFCFFGDVFKMFFYLDVGVVVGVCIGFSVKIIVDGDKYKVKDFYGLNVFKFDVVVRMGYGNIGVFVYYSFMLFFDKNLIVVIYLLNVGVLFNF